YSTHLLHNHKGRTAAYDTPLQPLTSASTPTATFCLPLSFNQSPFLPIAVFSNPTLLPNSAAEPIAVLLSPSAFAKRALSPTAVLPRRGVGCKCVVAKRSIPTTLSIERERGNTDSGVTCAAD